MKATDLMARDYLRVNRDGLCIPEGKIVRVTEVDSENTFREKGLKGCARCEAMDDTWLSGGVWCDYLDPIPLTPEILEKNGFSFTKNNNTDSVWNGWWIYEGLELAVANLNKEGNWPCFINIYDSNILCEYVHQLQHALRLCGIEKEITL